MPKHQPVPMKIPASWVQVDSEIRRARAVNRLLTGLLALLVAAGIAAAARGEAYTVQTDGGALNIRTKPWFGAEVAGTLANGDSVEVVSIADGWALVEAPVEAGEGYVSMDYLTCEPSKGGSYKVDAGGRVRVRKGPNGERVRWLEDGEAVEVLRWARVDGELWAVIDGGYVLADCLVAR